MAASASDAHPFPIYNARFRAIFPLLDADGDLVTGATTPDSELSQDCGTFADATNEMTEIATSSGMYFLDLIATEMDTKSTAIIAKSATAGMKTTPMVLYPVRLPVIRTGTAQAGAASTITLDAGASAIADYYVGCYVNITNDSPANARGQARKIVDYDGGTKVATVEGTYGTNPSNASTFEVLATPDWIQRLSDVNAFGGVASTQSAGRPEVNTTHAAGTAWGSGAITAASIATGAIDADAIADGAIDAGAIADGAIDAATFAAGAITASAIAADAIGASELAADAVAEIADAIWDEDATAHQTQGTFGQAIGDPGVDADTIWGLANANLDATVSSRASSAQATAIQADTDDLQTRVPAALVGGRMDSSVGAMAANVLTAAAIATDAITADKIAAAAITAVEAPNLDVAVSTRLAPTVAGRTLDVALTGEAGLDLDNTTGTLGAAEIPNLDAAISTRATPAQVNTEVSDVLKIDTIAERVAGAPPATPTFEEALSYLYMALRGRLDVDTVSGFKEFYNDALAVVWKKAITDAGGIYREDEGVTGP